MEQFEQKIREQNEIQKSHVNSLLKAVSSSELVRGIEDFKVSKKGKEIREKLVSQLSSMDLKKSEVLAKVIALRTKIGSEPEVDFSTNHQYMMEELGERDYKLPKEYGYDNRKLVDSSQNYPTYIEQSVKDLSNLKSQHDELVYSYARVCLEKYKLQTVLDNLEDNKTYNLSASLASKLGF